MTQIEFLNNAQIGKNNWWRYVITIIFSLLIGIIAAGFIVAALLLFYVLLISPGTSSGALNDFSIINNPLFIILLLGISYTISLIVFYLCSRFLHHKKFISFINARKHVRWKSLVKGAFLWILILGLFSLPSLILDPGSFKVTFNIYSFSFLLILSILTFPIQAFFEEIFFRGYLMQGFSLIFKRAIFPLIITSLLFGLMHFFNGTNTDQSLNIVISTTIMGLMWGLVTLADNGIELAAGSHIANNLYVALIFNPEDSGLTGIPSIITSPASEPFSGILVLLLAAIIFTGVLFWNRRDDLLTALKSKRD